MAKPDPNARVVELEERLADFKQQRIDLARSLEQIDAQLGVLVAEGGDDLETVAELRRERALDAQRLPEIEAAIPVIEGQLEAARADALMAEQKRFRRAAWEAAHKRAQVAAAIDRQLEEVGKLWDELVALTETENAELRAAGGGAGTATTMANRLHFIVPAVLWKHLSKMLTAARFERIPGSRWQTLASFLSVLPRKDVDAA